MTAIVEGAFIHAFPDTKEEKKRVRLIDTSLAAVILAVTGVGYYKGLVGRVKAGCVVAGTLTALALRWWQTGDDSQIKYQHLNSSNSKTSSDDHVLQDEV